MKKYGGRKKIKSNVSINAILLFLVIIIGVVILPTVRTKITSYGASLNAIPFTPAPAKSNLQLNWFFVQPVSPVPFKASQAQTTNSGNSQSQQNGNSNPQTNNTLQPIGSNPSSKIGHFQPAGPGPTTPVSNGQLCSVVDDSGAAVKGSCYCPDLSVTCKNGTGYGANGLLYPGPNPCGSSVAPGSGRFCVEKPVIYLYPTKQTYVDVQVQTEGSVVVSDPTYPQNGWKHILAQPNGTLTYNGNNYSELFYESSINKFQKPVQGITIPKNELSPKLNELLDELGLIGNEKKEFLTFWLPQLEELRSEYIFFSILPPSAKAAIDTVAISPNPDTQIAFIAYFKTASQTAKDTLQLPIKPARHGFVSVEWGGIIDK